MINPAHFHLILVHIPIVVFPLCAMLLLYGIVRQQVQVLKVSYAIIAGAALAAIIAYLTGEGAEELVEEISGVVERTIEEHEEGALFALILGSFTGVSGLVALYITNVKQNYFPAAKVLCALTLLSSGLFIRVGYLGGKIRHPEAYDQLSSQASLNTTDHVGRHEEHGEDEDD